MSQTSLPSPDISAPPADIDAATLRDLLARNQAVVIDVREPDEHARERIPGSLLRPLSGFDPSEIPAPEDGRRIVLHCRSGTRSAEAASRLRAAGRRDVVQLKGGIQAWKAAGGDVEGNPGLPIPIMRQVQIAAGSLVLGGTLLGALVSPWLLVIPGFVGAGLIFAGTTGACGMAALLRRMPWNRCTAPAACAAR